MQIQSSILQRLYRVKGFNDLPRLVRRRSHFGHKVCTLSSIQCKYTRNKQHSDTIGVFPQLGEKLIYKW